MQGCSAMAIIENICGKSLHHSGQENRLQRTLPVPIEDWD